MNQFKQDKLVIKIFKDRLLMGSGAAQEAIEYLRALPNLQNVFAAATSPKEFQEALVMSQKVDWTKVNALHMDEYIGL
jgi:glucosamine-6-phosphate deaminase